MSRPAWLLFDLGGVLVDFAGPRELPALLRQLAPPGDLKLRMAHCAVTDAFERGTLSPHEFAERFVRDWDVALPPDRFIALYTQWVRSLYPGVPALLAQLRTRYRLACLSNSNEAHWEHNDTMVALRGELHVALSSHQLGMRKPQPEIFAAALDRLQAPPEAVMFFDDLPANVQAARAAGLRAHHVDGFDALAACIAAERLLDDC